MSAEHEQQAARAPVDEAGAAAAGEPEGAGAGAQGGGPAAGDASAAAGEPRDAAARAPGEDGGDAQSADGPGGAGDPAGADAEAAGPDSASAEVEHDIEELLARAGKADEYLALAQRTQADFENFRKRMTRDVAAAETRGVARVAKELLPALDNLERALAAADGSDATRQAEGFEHFVAGVRLVNEELLSALKRVGIEPFSPRGERFDPNEHEAMAQQPVEGAESGTVVEVYQQGFRLGDAVLRPARVVVAA